MNIIKIILDILIFVSMLLFCGLIYPVLFEEATIKKGEKHYIFWIWIMSLIIMFLSIALELYLKIYPVN